MNGTAKVGLLVGGGIAVLLALLFGNGIGQLGSPAENPTNHINTPDYPAPPRHITTNKTKNSFNYYPTSYVGNQLIEHQYYALSYSTKHKNAEWVAYDLWGNRLNTSDAVERDNFVSDPATDAEVSSTAYLNSGYDRGHLVPAFDMNFNEIAMKEACYMTNVCPQIPEFNRGIWKSLEGQVRKWAVAYGKVYVVTGPILRHSAADAPRLKDDDDNPTIPRGYYKVVLDYTSKQPKGIGFLFKNKDIDQPLANFVVSIDRVEAYTNLDFFPDLSAAEQQQLEATVNPADWGL